MKKLALVLLGLSALVVSTANAETTKCKAITKLPAVISASGIYCLTKNLAFSSTGGVPATQGIAILVMANDVTIDLNSHVLDDSAAGNTTQATGISASTMDNVVVKNGTVRGFETGISLSNGNNNSIDGVVADTNTVTGIYVISPHGVIRNCLVTNTGGASFGSNVAAYGITAAGDHMRILDNSISGVDSQGTLNAYGIGPLNGSHIVVSRNLVSGISSPSGISLGIDLETGNDVIISDNRVSDTGTAGIAIYGTGTYMNNLVVDAATPYVGGTAAGSTNF